MPIVYNGAYFILRQLPLRTDVHYQGYAMLRLTSVCVFLFSALALTISSGYSLGALPLLLGSIYLLWKRPCLNLERQDYLLLASLLLYFLVLTLNMLYHRDPARELDMPSRALLAVPVLLLLLAYPPSPAAWWGGVAIGAISGAALALWQFTALDIARPQAATSNAIHYGNVSILLGMLAFCGIDWARTQVRRIPWTCLMLSGCIAGIAGSLLSGSRSGWLALPMCALIFSMQLARNYGKRYWTATGLLLALTCTLGYFMPQSSVHKRAAISLSELQQFERNGAIESSVGERIEMWRTALQMSKQHVWLGMGRNGYMTEKQQLVAEGNMSISVRNYTNAHNDYIDTLVKRGVIGILALLNLFFLPLALFSIVLYRNQASTRPFALAGVTLCSCYAVFGMTTSSLTLNIGIIMLTFPMVMLWAMLRHAQRTN